MSESLIKARVYLMHRKKVAFDTPTDADIFIGNLCDQLEEAEKSLADSKAREGRYRDALEKIAQQKTHEWDGESLFSYIIAEQALQDIPEEQP